ncbi:MAG: V-type ATP synthase subunit D, partial [Candidatus Korarchaeota archaeon]|nr:V-type ATP synthase subunit D [Candidatus Korarchaeota archaeon]NIU83469.1 V-type ATP synthase subunit D [Candidatus Thorarchaeota archaeon]NIW13745.1 V-type ATP synthase subunit D [Candidatus Thorarchaeota archaeon]NIW51840.1 V-type ATP synthase subunit D [Candidatus Korarchaeota archaeon]
RISEELQRTNRIVNSLEEIMIPRMKKTIKKIEEKLEEELVEEFIRVKEAREIIRRKR